MKEQPASKVPQIRFKGFEGEWSEMPMEQLLTFKNGYNASKSQYGRGEKFINVLDIIRNDYITYDKIIGRVSIPLKEFAKNEVIYGDILFQRSSETLEEVGQANVYLDKTRAATFGGFVIRGRPLIDFNPSFFNATLKPPKSRSDITSRSGGSTRYNIGQESLEASLVRIAPDLLEQGKVADFVMSVDRLIGLHQRKHEKLVTLKKAMLQKMFPQYGVTTPEIRFKGFSGDWVENTLKTAADITTGFPFKSSDFSASGAYLVVTNGNIQNEQSFVDSTAGNRVSIENSARLNQFILRAGDILVTMDGSVGRTAKVREKNQVLAQRVGRLVAKSDSEFLYQVLNTGAFLEVMTIISHGGTIKHISLGEIGEYTFFAPSSGEEQKIIGTYFRSLDELISQHAIQLQKLQQIKSACLEKMFI
jgi:type I restriction enzyme, S subunit